MKAERSKTLIFPQTSLDQYTTRIDSNRIGSEEQLPARETLFPTDAAETVRLLRSLTPYTSNRNIYESFCLQGELPAALREQNSVDGFL